MPPQMISISCESSPAPGVDCLIKVEFRPLLRGFSVWVFEDYLMVGCPKWRKTGGDSKPLDWRTAGTYLVKDDSLRVIASLWESVEIGGMVGWAADVIRCLIIEHEDAAFDYRAIGELLIGFNDNEIKSLLEEIGPIPAYSGEIASQTSLLALQRLSKSTRGLGLNGHSLFQIRTEIGLDGDATIEDIALASEQMDARRRVAKLLSVTPHRNEQGSAPVAESKEGFGIHSSEKARHDLWVELSAGAPPEDISQRVALAECWLSEPKNQVGSATSVGIGQPDSEWPILKWLLGKEERIRSLLERLSVERPVKATNLVEQIMKLGKAEAYYFEGPNRLSGWVMNVVGRPIKRSNVQFALLVQSIANQLKIPIDEKYRIGELPHLN